MADEAAAAVEFVETETTEYTLAPLFEEEGDYWPGLILGINSIFGTTWWIISWFVFVKNTSGDAGLKSIAKIEVLPIGFFWERFLTENDAYSYLALSMFFNFVTFFLVSFIEMIAWIIYVVGEPTFFGWYVNVIGFWGSIVLYMLPPILAISHIGLKLQGATSQQPGSYCIFLSVIGITMWLLNAFLHVFYAERLAAHIATKVPYVEPDYSGAKPADKVCKIPRGTMTDEQYEIACEAIEKAELAKAGQFEGSDAAADADEENEEATEEPEYNDDDSDAAF